MPAPVLVKGMVITVAGVAGSGATVYKSSTVTGQCDEVDITDTADTERQTMPGRKDHDTVKVTVVGGTFAAGDTVVVYSGPGSPSSVNGRIVSAETATDTNGLATQTLTLEMTSDTPAP